jgi:hypothetical protein
MLFTAGCLVILLGLVHSLLGEYLIFRHLRDGGITPTKAGELLKERHVRILWASWHLVTVFGWGISAIIFGYYLSSSPKLTIPSFVIISIALSMIAGAALVLFATQGKHPAWLVLVTIAILVWLNLY